MTEAEIMGLIAGVVGLVLCLAFGLGELVGDLARRAARPWQGWRKPTSRCAASTCESRPWRWCGSGGGRGMSMPGDEAARLLQGLRWDVDMDVINHDGEHVWVWLGPALNDDGERTGITDCCEVANPCDHHAPMTPRLQ